MSSDENQPGPTVTPLAERLRTVYDVFLAEGAKITYGVSCCGRVYLGLDPATTCRTCTKTPHCVEIQSVADLERFAGLVEIDT